MMYRAKCTWCEKDVMEIYKGVELNKVSDAHDVYVEVTTDRQAEAIEELNKCSKERLMILQEIVHARIDAYQK